MPSHFGHPRAWPGHVRGCRHGGAACCLGHSVCSAEPEVVRPAEVAIWRRTCQSQEFSQKTCAKETFSKEWAWGLISALRTTVCPEGLGVSRDRGLDSMLRDRVHFSLDLSPEWSGFFSQSHTASLRSLNGNSAG